MNFQYPIGITKLKNPSTSFLKYLYVKTILVYGLQGIRTFRFLSQEPIGPLSGIFTKHISNFDIKEEDSEWYTPFHNNIEPWKLDKEVNQNLE